jgi:hypothetical protein
MRCAWSRAANWATASCTVWFFSCFSSSATIGRPLRKTTKSISCRVSPKIEVRTKGEAVLAVSVRCGALDRAGFRVVEAERQPAHFQAVAQDHPQRRVLQLPAQGAKDFFARIARIVVGERSELLGLRRLQEGPELIFGDAVFAVGDFRLLEYAVAMHADQEVRDVLLEIQFRRSCAWHGRFSRAGTRYVRAIAGNADTAHESRAARSPGRQGCRTAVFRNRGRGLARASTAPSPASR